MFSPRTPSPQAPPWWFLGLLGLYAVLELSFNHHLMQIASGDLVTLEALEDLEFWARIISGLGLAFWLLRACLPRLLFLALWALALGWSWTHLGEDLQSPGYREVARPALRTEQPLLAPFVEWSLRAEPAWQAPTRWLHQTLLGSYGFGRLPLP